MVDKSKRIHVDKTENKAMYSILIIIGFCHLLNDSLQAVIPAMFPILEKSLGLTFTQLGLIAFTLNIVASVMQPVVGIYTDKRPVPYALPVGLSLSMIGMFGLAFAPNLGYILVCVILIGLGSATFHPEGARVAFLAGGTKRGLSQSIFQVGGNTGQALAPVITALLLIPLGQFGAIWFTLIAFIAVLMLLYVAKWYSEKLNTIDYNISKKNDMLNKKTPSKMVKNALIILIFIVFARSWYQSAIANFYAFYAIEGYGLSIAQSQLYIFAFLFMGAVGTFFGGPLADRFGNKNLIILSLLGPAPLTVILPYVGQSFAIILIGTIGFLLFSSFSVAVVYAQELVPGKIGTMSGLIIGLGFGMGAIGGVALGAVIDTIGLDPTMKIISFLPLLGLLSFKLPSDEKIRNLNVSI